MGWSGSEKARRGFFEVRGEGDWGLAVEYLEPPVAPKGIAICGHAMLCNRSTLDSPRGRGLGSTLAAKGIGTYLFDLRGHGESVLHSLLQRGPTYDDFVLRDIPAVVRAVQSRHPDLPIALVGHSLSAHAGVTAVSVAALPVKAIVSLGGSVFWVRDLEPSRVVWLGKRVTVELWGVVASYYGVFPARRWRLGVEDAALPFVQQLVRNARCNRWESSDGRFNYLERLSELAVPILSVVSAADRWLCRPAAAQAWLAHARKAFVTHRVVGARHDDPADIGHMGLVKDPRMRPIWLEIADWLSSFMRL